MSFVAGFEKVAGVADAAKAVGSAVMSAARKKSFQGVVGRAAIKGAVGGAVVGGINGAMSKDQNGQSGGISGALGGAVKGGAIGGVAGGLMPVGQLAMNKYNRLPSAAAGKN